MFLGTTTVALAQCVFPVSRTSTEITYRFQPEISPDRLILHVTLEFQTGPDGTETLVLPTRWAGEMLHAVINMRAISSGASLTDGPDAGTKLLHAPARQRVVVGYDLQKDWTGPLVHPMQFHPVLMPEYLDQLQRAVAEHGVLTPPDQIPSLGGCAHQQRRSFPTFDLGLDLARSRASNQITGVVEGGPAFGAGLREGQPLAGVSVNDGDPDRQAIFRIHTDTGDKEIRFYPRGTVIEAWQYDLDPSQPCARVP